MHRDLKPANIFIGGDGTLKVGDLGLGRIFSSETIEAYSKVGTPLYMSPEVLIYKKGRVAAWWRVWYEIRYLVIGMHNVWDGRIQESLQIEWEDVFDGSLQ